MSLSDSTHIRSVTLIVRNLEEMERFYVGLLGLQPTRTSDVKTEIGLPGSPILFLEQSDTLPIETSGNAGLYHTAFLFEQAGDLARSLIRLFKASPSLYQGSGDHLVSQAFYAADPEGNGIELAVDRPRSEWNMTNGRIQMGSEYIDINQFVSDHYQDEETGSVSIGHIHLKVGSIGEAKAFYVDELGFDIVAEMPSALFVSAGGYHHHIGLNNWESSGAGLKTPSLGLESFAVAGSGIKGRYEDPWGTVINFS